MREIKFRAFISGESGLLKRGYVYFTLAELQYSCGIPVLSANSGLVHTHQCIGCSEDGPFEYHFPIEQWTGLRDKNGRDIYEGDILLLEDPEDASRCEVAFVDGAYRKRYRDWDETIPYPVLDHAEIELLGLYVAGNIHENPDLVKGE